MGGSNKNWPWFAGLLIGSVALLEIAEIGISQMFASADLRNESAVWPSIVRVVRTSILLLLSVDFVAYAINWLRVCYLDDVRTERHLERYGHDIDRASFVIETIMGSATRKVPLFPMPGWKACVAISSEKRSPIGTGKCLRALWPCSSTSSLVRNSDPMGPRFR